MYNQGNIMRKLLGKTNNPDSSSVNNSHDNTPSSSVANGTSHGSNITSNPSGGLTSIPNYRQRPTAAQNASYQAGQPLECIDRSPDGRSAVLAGRHALRTVTFDGLNIREGIDLRSLLQGGSPDQLAIRDVKWGPAGGNPTIFTACGSGKIFQYDLVRASEAWATGSPLESLQIREDSRQVNTLDVNPHRASYLLSGSQDGIVRCFDIRNPVPSRTGATFRPVHAYKCNADGVRQVRWSPKDGFVFACSTDQGTVLQWDMRKYHAPVLRINAHEKSCTSIAWHPDGEHLVSAGWDSKCHVWHLGKVPDKRQKPKWTISTPAPVASLAWRPGQWSATAQAKRASQIAMSYGESSQKKFGINAVHIWDLARPTMPYREIQLFDSSPNSLLWHDQYLLWTVGQDGLFTQCDVNFAPKVLDRQAVSTMSFSSQGDVLMFLDERAPSHRPRPHILHADSSHSIGAPSYSSSPTTPRFGVSRSDSEDDVLGSFLGPKQRTSQRKRRPSTRSATLSTTPPTGSEEVLSLEQTIKVTGIYKPQQAMAIGHLPAAAKADMYEYLTVNYLEVLYQELPYVEGGRPLPDRVKTILDHYAKTADSVNQYRLAQSWRVLAYWIDLVLRRRGQYHLERRLDHYEKRKMEGKLRALGPPFQMSVQTDGVDTPRKANPRSLLSEELESTSNQPTPLARPVTESAKLTPVLESGSFALGPALQPRGPQKRDRLDSVPLSIVSFNSENTQASTEGYDFYDTEAILGNAIDVPGKRLEDPRKSVLRHDSDDSFGHALSVSAGSRRGGGTAIASSVESTGGLPIRGSALAEIRYPRGSDGSERASDIQMGSAGRPRFVVPPQLNRTETETTGMTAYTDEHHAITQSTTDYSFPSQNDDDILHAAPPVVITDEPPTLPEEPEPEPTHIIETDYLPWPSDPAYPYPLHNPPSFSSTTPPLNPYSLISRTLAFEAKSSALNASAIVLLLKPLVSDEVIDRYQAAAILRQHHSRLMNLQLFVEAALLRKLCMQGWPAAAAESMPGDQEKNPLKDWGINYPAIFTPAQNGVSVGFFCSSCHKARELDRSEASTDSVWTCKRCKAAAAPCALCGHRDSSPFIPSSSESTISSLQPDREGEDDYQPIATWWLCPVCGHGGHSSCMQAWHASFEAERDSAMYADGPVDNDDPAAELASSGGYCPLDGCGHVCLPGPMRLPWGTRGTGTDTGHGHGMASRMGETMTEVPSRAGTAREREREIAAASSYSRSAGSKTPVFSGGNKTPVLSGGNRTPVFSGGSKTPVFSGGSKTPVFSGHSSLTGHGDTSLLGSAADRGYVDLGPPALSALASAGTTSESGGRLLSADDALPVAQSRAVESVRDTGLAFGIGPGGGIQAHHSHSQTSHGSGSGSQSHSVTGILSSSPGRIGAWMSSGLAGHGGEGSKGEGGGRGERDKERRKSVKFVTAVDGVGGGGVGGSASQQ
ncbi:SEA (Seh1-associated) complex subunit [Neurospora sp. IMI 360204]|nr:SEA (Seh1-associated) complex subunit [Neurospora sp. IMI 360204]